MPIYAYKCGSCGHARDVLQKVSDAPLTTCPECGADTYCKQITAAGFQLKGSGWYVTDFRNNSSNGASSKSASKPADGGADAGAGTTGKSDGDAKPAVSSSSSGSDGPAAAGGCGSACACH